MNKQIKLVGFGALSLAFVLTVFAYFLQAGFWQNLSLGVGMTLLGLGLAVTVVTLLLTSLDKRVAAKPLLKLIAPNVEELHNDLFIKYGHTVFGKEKFEWFIDIYSKHDGKPTAFSPDERANLYKAIEGKKIELLRVYDALSEQLQEFTLILGWSFDSKLTAAAMEARLNYATFRSITWDGSEASHLTAIESFFDAELATSAVFSGLTKHLGLSESEWQRKS